MSFINYLVNFKSASYTGVIYVVRNYEWKYDDPCLRGLVNVITDMFENTAQDPINIKLYNEERKELTFEEECSVID